ncbi:MAG: hypothetical protein OK474_05010 [Thaumarchaeota archaeon]|nr:hypothetical protein [Nitrososphaerota archaeon]
MTDRLPLVEDLVFWLLENAFVLAFVGTYGLTFHTVPGLPYSALAVLVALVYVLLGRRRYIGATTKEVVRVTMILSSLVLLVDLVVTGGLTAFSVFIDLSSIILAFYAYKEYRREKMGNRGVEV